jgi:hypothetical protein
MTLKISSNRQLQRKNLINLRKIYYLLDNSTRIKDLGIMTSNGSELQNRVFKICRCLSVVAIVEGT